MASCRKCHGTSDSAQSLRGRLHAADGIRSEFSAGRTHSALKGLGSVLAGGRSVPVKFLATISNQIFSRLSRFYRQTPGNPVTLGIDSGWPDCRNREAWRSPLARIQDQHCDMPGFIAGADGRPFHDQFHRDGAAESRESGRELCGQREPGSTMRFVVGQRGQYRQRFADRCGKRRAGRDG